MITGRSDRDMYLNARKQLGKDGFMNTWQLPEGERHNLSHKEESVKISIKDVVTIIGAE